MSKSLLVDEEWPLLLKLFWVPPRVGLMLFKSSPNKSSWFDDVWSLAGKSNFGDAKRFSFVGLVNEVCFLAWLDYLNETNK